MYAGMHADAWAMKSCTALGLCTSQMSQMSRTVMGGREWCCGEWCCGGGRSGGGRSGTITWHNNVACLPRRNTSSSMFMGTGGTQVAWARRAWEAPQFFMSFFFVLSLMTLMTPWLPRQG